MGKSIWQSMEQKGYSRREFLQFCAAAATAADLGQSGVDQVVEAFEAQEKVPVLWLHFHECACCSESFLRALHPVVGDALLDIKELSYQKTLAAISGTKAKESFTEIVRDQMGRYIVLVEGAIPAVDGSSAFGTVLKTLAEGAAAILAWGSCSSNGGIQAAGHELVSAKPIQKLVAKQVINVPGCPPIGDVMMNLTTHLLVRGQVPPAEQIVRPRQFYGRRMHTAPLLQPDASQSAKCTASSMGYETLFAC